MAVNTASAPLNKWESIYQQGKECNVAPFDEVVSFVYRHKPDIENHKVRILEVGCGLGNNLTFLAKQKFTVHGIELSETGHRIARNRMIKEGFWDERIQQGSFTCLPYANDSYDLVIDRAALTTATPDDMVTALKEVNRVLKVGGKLLFTPYAAPEKNGVASFYSFTELKKIVYDAGFNIETAQRNDVIDLFGDRLTESHFRIVARKF